MPHPYVGHQETERLAAQCDLIEVVNCRASPVSNRQAGELAASLGKRAYVSPDAHFAHSLGNAIVEVENMGSLRTSLMQGEIRWNTPRLTGQIESGASQLISAVKLRDVDRFKVLAQRTIKRLRKMSAGRAR